MSESPSEEAKILVQRSIDCCKAGKYEAALEYFDQVIKLEPEHAVVYYGKGDCLDKLGRHEEAIEMFERATSIDPDDVDSYFYKGVCLSELGRRDEAIESFNRATSIDPEWAEAYYNKGVCLSELGHHEEAIESYDQAISFNSENADAYYNKGFCLGKLGRYEEEIESYNRAISINPQSDDAYYNKGVCLSKMGRHEEAIESYGRAILINPEYAGAYFNKGNGLDELGRYEEAIDSYQIAIQLKPANWLYWLGYASFVFKFIDNRELSPVSIAECLPYLNRSLSCVRKNGRRPGLVISRGILKMLVHFDAIYSIRGFLDSLLPAFADAQLDHFPKDELDRMSVLLPWVKQLKPTGEAGAMEPLLMHATLAHGLKAPWATLEITDYRITREPRSAMAVAYRYWAKCDMVFDQDEVLSEALGDGSSKDTLPSLEEATVLDRYYMAWLFFEDTEWQDAVELLVQNPHHLPSLYARAWFAREDGDQTKAMKLLEGAIQKELELLRDGECGLLWVPKDQPLLTLDPKEMLPHMLQWIHCCELKEALEWAKSAIDSGQLLVSQPEAVENHQLVVAPADYWRDWLLRGQLSSEGQIRANILLKTEFDLEVETLRQEIAKTTWWKNLQEKGTVTESVIAEAIFDEAKSKDKTIAPIGKAIMLRYVEKAFDLESATQLMEYVVLEGFFNLRRRGYARLESREAAQVIVPELIGFGMMAAVGASFGVWSSLLVPVIRGAWYLYEQYLLSKLPDAFPLYDVFLRERKEYLERMNID